MEKVGDDDDGDDYDDAVIVVPFDGHQVVDVHQAPPLLAYTQNSTGTLLLHYANSSRGTLYSKLQRHTILFHYTQNSRRTQQAHYTHNTHYFFFPQLEKSTLHCNTGWTASGAGGRRSDVW